MTLGFTAIAASATALVEGTKEYRTAMGGLETAFTTNGLSAEQAKKSYQSLYGVLGDTGKASEAARFLGLMADNEKELTEWTNAATGIYAVFGDTLPIEGLTEAANETAKVGQVTGTLADALNWVGISEDEFNEKLAACTDEQEREQLIRETLNETYSEAADSYREVNGEIIATNEAEASMQESSANLATSLQPLITAGKTLLVEVLNKISPAIQFVIDNINWLGPVIATVWGTITALGMVNKIQGFITNIQGAFSILMANPIVLIVAAIVAAIVLLIANWDKVKEAFAVGIEFFKNLFEGFKEKCGQIFDWIKNKFELFKQACLAILDSFKQRIMLFVDLVKTQFNDVKNTISNIFNNIKNIFQNIINFVKNVFTGNWKGAWENVKNIFKNIADALGNIFKAPINFIINAINTFIKGLNKIKIPDWVPAVGGKGINIPLIPKLRVGMEYVPYDEMPALLHKGEAVLTADENRHYQESMSQSQPTATVIDYDELEERMSRAFIQAFTEFKGVIKVDDMKMGDYIISKVEEVVY